MDAYQDTFLSAFRSIRTLRDPARLRGWVLQIAANAARKRFRGKHTALPTTPIPDHSEPEDPTQDPIPNALADREDTARIRGAVSNLPDRQREVLSLRTDAGLSYAEIAETLGIREDNARAHHYQALKSLRRILLGLDEPRRPAPPATERPISRPSLRKLP